MRWLVLLALLATAAAETPKEERLWHHRNLGKAFYENPTTQYEAVDELKKALDLAPDSPRERLNYALALLKAGKTAEGVKELEAVQKQAPEIPHPWFNLGIVFKQESEYEKALRQFERMAALVPDEPVTHYNLGVLYKLTDRPDLAVKHFERAADLNSYFAAPRFQLFNSYRQAGKTEEAARRKKEYDEIKEAQKGAAVPEDVDWSWYRELLDEIDPPAAHPRRSSRPSKPPSSAGGWKASRSSMPTATSLPTCWRGRRPGSRSS